MNKRLLKRRKFVGARLRKTTIPIQRVSRSRSLQANDWLKIGNLSRRGTSAFGSPAHGAPHQRKRAGASERGKKPTAPLAIMAGRTEFLDQLSPSRTP